MNEITKACAAVTDALVSHPNTRQAVKYLSEKQVVRATRRVYRRAPRRKNGPVEIVLTICQPNFDERKFLAKWKGSGSLFWRKTVYVKSMK